MFITHVLIKINSYIWKLTQV